MEFWPALLEHEFLQRALAGGLLASIGCGVVGSYVVVQRISLLAGAIAHAVLGGMGVAWYFGAEREDTAISAIWALGMAIGILFIAKTPGYSVDLMGYLFGNLLMMSSSDLKLIAALDVVILGLAALFFRQFLAVCFDPEFARVRGLKVERYYLLLLVLVALTVVMLIQVVGLILVIALMTLPAAIAGRFTSSLAAMMGLAVLLGMLFTSGGLAISYAPDLPSGPVIIVLAGVGYLLAALVKRGAR
jgi:zinc transport system permease protein